LTIITKFDPKCNFISKGYLGLDPEDLDGYPTGIAVNGDTVAVTIPGLTSSRHFTVYEFTMTSLFIAKFGQVGLDEGQIEDARFIATESDSKDIGRFMHYVIGLGENGQIIKKYEHKLQVQGSHV
jgi:hypothetical protein